MYFGGEDELAIQTVAAASYRLLADLKAERGKDEAADVYLTGTFYVVRDFRRGTLPKNLMNDPAFMVWAKWLAEQLPIGPETKIEDVSVHMSPEAARSFWRERNKVANFLKHADRDVEASIALDEVDNLLLLMQSFSAYADLARDGLGNEGLVFELFINADSTPSNPATQREDLLQKLAAAPESDRRKMCSMLVRELNKMDEPKGTTRGT